jgi:hypothetical protein
VRFVSKEVLDMVLQNKRKIVLDYNVYDVERVCIFIYFYFFIYLFILNLYGLNCYCFYTWYCYYRRTIKKESHKKT